jgi:hypothetical protein
MVVSSSSAHGGHVESKTLRYVVIVPLLEFSHLEVRITGLKDITSKTNVLCRSGCGTSKNPYG